MPFDPIVYRHGGGLVQGHVHDGHDGTVEVVFAFDLACKKKTTDTFKRINLGGNYAMNLIDKFLSSNVRAPETEVIYQINALSFYGSKSFL